MFQHPVVPARPVLAGRSIVAGSGVVVPQGNRGAGGGRRSGRLSAYQDIRRGALPSPLPEGRGDAASVALPAVTRNSPPPMTMFPSVACVRRG